MSDLITIEEAILNFRELIHSSIKDGGAEGKRAMIRSSKPINNIHEAIKAELIRNGINEELIHPPVGNTKPELKLAGFIKQKYQDICAVPGDISLEEEELKEGLLQGKIDIYGHEYTEKTLSINVRSQISSLAKNFDTLYERTIAEAQNLHVRCSEICLGEIYMIAVPEYSSDGVKENKTIFLNKVGTVEKYVKSFQAINGRKDTSKEDYKYERVCLLIVDFSTDIPKIYNSDENLKEAGLLAEDSEVSISELTWETFTSSLIETYQARFGT